MAIYFHWNEAHDDLWQAAFESAGIVPDLRSEEELGNPDDVEFAVVWAPPKGRLKGFRNLRYIFSIGAGVTHITDDPDFPSQVPIVRLQDDMLVLDMSCHIIHWVLHFHRFYHRYKQYEAERKWLRHRYPDNADKRVAIMGLGQTGQDACRRLRDLGFDVTGWARSPKQIEGVRCLHGEDQFDTLLERADILVNLLPLTSQTENILNAGSLARMPRGAFVINCSRGASIDDAALLAALETGADRGRCIGCISHRAVAARRSLLAAPQHVCDPARRRTLEREFGSAVHCRQHSQGFGWRNARADRRSRPGILSHAEGSSNPVPP